MGNVATTPALSGHPADGGVTPSKMASKVSRGSATEKWGHVAKGSSTPQMWTVELFGTEGAVHAKAAFNVSDVDDAWSAATIAVHPDASGISVERLNKIMRLLTDSVGSAPRIDLYWRTGKAAVRCPGYAGRQTVPVIIRGTRGATSGEWMFDMTTFGGQLIIPGKPRKAQSKTVKAPKPTMPAVPAPTPSVVVGEPKPKASTRAERREARRAAAAEQRQVASAPVEPKAREATKVVGSAPVIFSDPATIRPGFAVHHDPAMLADLKREAKLHAAGRRTVVLISGPTGTGKTLTAKHMAAEEGLPFLKVDAAAMATFADWVGAVSLKEGQDGVVTAFAPSLLLEAVRADGPFGGIRRMVLLDEVNRVAQGQSLAALMPMTDGQGTLYVPDALRSIPVDPAVMWVMTANMGSAYSGTVHVDPAIMNRVTSHLEVKYPLPLAEQQMLVEQSGCTATVAQALVNVAAQVRKAYDSGAIATPAVSTRQLIEAAAKVAVGCDPIHACELAFAHNYSAEGGVNSERNIVMVAVRAVLSAGVR
jgi:MoxR-like ATPase